MRNLFIVGAQRSGSTYLRNILNDHYEVQMTKASKVEPKFFLKKKINIKQKEFYEQKYYSKKRKNIKYLGEKSTSYIEHSYALKNIKKFYPDAQILVILRNPTLRAYSNYRFSKKNCLEKNSFKLSLELESKRLLDNNFNTSVNPYAYKKRGVYIKYIRELYKIYKKEQINLIIYEEFINNINEIQKLYKLLSIDSDVIPKSIDKKINTTIKSEDVDIDTLIYLDNYFKESIKQLEIIMGRKIDAWNTN